MAFIEVAISEAVAKEAMPEGSYNLVITDAQPYHNDNSGKDSIQCSIGFEDHVDASNITHFIALPDDAAAQLGRQSRNRRLDMWLGREKREEILDWWRPYARKNKIAPNALFFVRDYQRSFPFGPMLGQLLHTLHIGRPSGRERV